MHICRLLYSAQVYKFTAAFIVKPFWCLGCCYILSDGHPGSRPAGLSLDTNLPTRSPAWLQPWRTDKLLHMLRALGVTRLPAGQFCSALNVVGIWEPPGRLVFPTTLKKTVLLCLALYNWQKCIIGRPIAQIVCKR